MALDAGDNEEAVNCCLRSGDPLGLSCGRVPLRSSDGFLGGEEAGEGDPLSLEEDCLCPKPFSLAESFGTGE